MVSSAQAASQSPLSSQAGYGEMLLVSLVLVAVVCGVGYVVSRAFGRGWRGRSGQGLMEVVARQALEPRRSLYVVRVAGRALLLGTSEMGLTLLTELELDEAGVVAQRDGRSFAELVRDAGARWAARRRSGERGASADLGGADPGGADPGEAVPGKAVPGQAGGATQGSPGVGSMVVR